MVNRTDLLKRLAVLARRYNPEVITLPQIAMNVVHIVPWYDPLCGTWDEMDATPPFARCTAFYGCDRKHLEQLIEQYHAEEDNKTGEL